MQRIENDRNNKEQLIRVRQKNQALKKMKMISIKCVYMKKIKPLKIFQQNRLLERFLKMHNVEWKGNVFTLTD